jgi:hypothetical protein
MDCSKIKEEYYECIKQEKLGYDPGLLKYKASASLQKLNDIRITEDVYKKCKGSLFSKCLSHKYELKSINEKELADYYNKKYEEKIAEKSNEILSNNSIKNNK